jgi:hypothetical protein
MSVKERLVEKAEIYIVSAIMAPLALAGMWATLDARHEKKGAVAEVEIRELKREQRKLENYQRLSPNSEYSAAREAEISALEDEIEELERELE